MKIEITWTHPDGGKSTLPPYTPRPEDPQKDDEQAQIANATTAAQTLLRQELGTAPPLDQLSIKVIKN